MRQGRSPEAILLIVMHLLVACGCETMSKAEQEAAARLAEQRKADEQARDEVMRELERYYADLSARKWTAFASHFWPGATITTIWQPPGEDQERVVVTSVPDFVAKAPSGPGSKPIFEETMRSADITVRGDLAQAWAKYEARFGEPGDVAEWTGIDAFTLLRHDGRWKIVSIVFAAD